MIPTKQREYMNKPIVYPKIKISPDVLRSSRRGAESNGLRPRKLRSCLPPFPNRTRTLPPKLGGCALVNEILYATVTIKKRHFVLIKARMTAIGPYVVVFWPLSRLVLVRKGCDAVFGPYSQSRTDAYTCHLVTVPAGYTFYSVPVTRVEPLS